MLTVQRQHSFQFCPSNLGVLRFYSDCDFYIIIYCCDPGWKIVSVCALEVKMFNLFDAFTHIHKHSCHDIIFPHSPTSHRNVSWWCIDRSFLVVVAWCLDDAENQCGGEHTHKSLCVRISISKKIKTWPNAVEALSFFGIL